MLDLRVLLHLCFLFLCSTSYGQVRTSPWTTDDSSTFQVIAKQSLLTEINAHQSHLSQVGVGLFYGTHSRYSPLSSLLPRWTDLHRFEFIKKALKPQFVDQMRSSNALSSYINSLVGTQDSENRQGDIRMLDSVLWSLTHLKISYKAINREARVLQIEENVLKSKNPALRLILELQNDGWNSVYWNPDTSLCSLNSTPQLKRYHQITLQRVQQQGYFLTPNLKVDSQLLNYNPSPNCNTTKEPSALLLHIKRVPFWIGLYNNGRNLFVGSQGSLTTVNSQDMPTSSTLLQNFIFETWQNSQTRGNSEGLILLPPHTLPE